MDNLLHYGGMLVTIAFILAVLYSLFLTLRKRRRKKEKAKEIDTYEHVKVKNLHQYDLRPENGYFKYPIETTGYTRRFPQRFTAISLELANEQPYSICLIGFAEFENGELKDRHYYYVQPPENNFDEKTKEAGVTWELVKKAYEFGEYWEAGMKDYFINHTLVAHNAPYVMGCIEHALKVFGIEVPRLQFIDTLDIAKKFYTFESNGLESICDEMGIEVEMHNSLSEASAIGQFLIFAKKDFPVFLPRIQYMHGEATEDEILASAVSTVEREEATPEEMFAPRSVSEEGLKKLLDMKYLILGEKPGTYYATNSGLDFAEDIDKIPAAEKKK
jgi:DNA polymerase III alpha subunit (gram-positive type)